MKNKEKYGNYIKCEYSYTIDYLRNKVTFGFVIHNELSWDILYQKHYSLNFEEAQKEDLIDATLLKEWLEQEV